MDLICEFIFFANKYQAVFGAEIQVIIQSFLIEIALNWKERLVFPGVKQDGPISLNRARPERKHRGASMSQAL